MDLYLYISKWLSRNIVTLLLLTPMYILNVEFYIFLLVFFKSQCESLSNIKQY